MKFTIRETDSQGRKIKWMTNTECVRIFAGKDIGECCGNCRFYDDSRGIRKPVCLKNPGLRVVYAGLCGSWKGRDRDETSGDG